MQPLFDFYYYAVWCYDPVGQPDDYLRPALGWCSLRPRHGRSALFEGHDNPGISGLRMLRPPGKDSQVA